VTRHLHKCSGGNGRAASWRGSPFFLDSPASTDLVSLGPPPVSGPVELMWGRAGWFQLYWADNRKDTKWHHFMTQQLSTEPSWLQRLQYERRRSCGQQLPFFAISSAKDSPRVSGVKRPWSLHSTLLGHWYKATISVEVGALATCSCWRLSLMWMPNELRSARLRCGDCGLSSTQSGRLVTRRRMRMAYVEEMFHVKHQKKTGTRTPAWVQIVRQVNTCGK